MANASMDPRNENFRNASIMQHPITKQWAVGMEQDGFASYEEAMLFVYVAQKANIFQTMANMLEQRGVNLETGEGATEAIPQVFIDAFLAKE